MDGVYLTLDLDYAQKIMYRVQLLNRLLSELFIDSVV